MIPRTHTHCQTDNTTNNDIITPQNTSEPIASNRNNKSHWQQELAAANITVAQLLERIDIPADHFRKLILDDARIPKNFPVRVTASYIAKIKKGDIHDPLLRQVLPLTAELEQTAGYSLDPLAEQQHSPAPGLIQKYHGRALLIVAKACAIHCRYCFRRHFPYDDNLPSKAGWQQVFELLTQDTSINEVIYSGGDPLAANDKHLAWLTSSIAAIPHIKRLRIHTRLPVVLPSRINSAMLKWLTSWQGQRIMVIHCNHPNELGDDVASALKLLSANGVTLLNQAVLLKGVNDSATILSQLSEKLFDMGVLPYYLHQLDPVQGAQHFAVNKIDAQQLIKEVSQVLPGFLVPKLVEEIAGMPAKTPINALPFTPQPKK